MSAGAESAATSCVSDQRPGPHAESDSLTAKAKPIHSVPLSALALPASGAYACAAVPSKNTEPSGDVEGVCVPEGV